MHKLPLLKTLCLCYWFVWAATHTAKSDDPVTADLIVVNARIRTMALEVPTAEALAVAGNKIVAVGTNETIRQRANDSTRVIDAQGKLVLPGFNDAHVHFVAGGRQLSSVDLRDAKTPEEFADRIAKYAETIPPGTWITGGDWDHENWPNTELPTRQLIDQRTSKHPVFVNRLDGHMAVANSLALQIANVIQETPDPDGGFIVRDASGNPTGVLKDAAMNLVYAKVPRLKIKDRLAAARAATNHAARLGVTSVQDMSGSSDIELYVRLWHTGELKTRIYAAAPLPNWKRSAESGLKAAIGTDWIREGGLKGFADGSLGSTTALFFENYLDAPRTAGLPSDEMFPEGAMFQRVQAADRAGLQIMIHAIGDRANDQILSIFEQLIEEHGIRDRRCRIEHAQHLRLQDIPRFATAQVIASMQPYHCADDGRWAEKRIGADRARGTYAFRSLLDAKAVLAFGSDWNVAPLDPLQGIAAAVTRQTLDGRNPDGWVPEQKITVAEAIRAYTVGSAYAEFQEHKKGTLEPGKLADFIVLSRNLFEIPSHEIKTSSVVLTVVDGKVVYEEPSER